MCARQNSNRKTRVSHGVYCENEGFKWKETFIFVEKDVEFLKKRSTIQKLVKEKKGDDAEPMSPILYIVVHYFPAG